MTSKFSGFPDDLFAFFAELAVNNDREWFSRNKARYQSSVVTPMCEFIAAMGPRLGAISDCFVADPRPHSGSMFRIYRDVRFSPDKRPYKENAGCHFRHVAGRDAHAPGYYVHLAPGEVFFGGGIWRPPSGTLRKVRAAIAEDPEGWNRAAQGGDFVACFGAVAGDGLKRPPAGFDADHPCIEALKRKSHYATRQVDPAVARTPRFIEEVDRAFVALTPLMKFLTAALDVPFSRGA